MFHVCRDILYSYARLGFVCTSLGLLAGLKLPDRKQSALTDRLDRTLLVYLVVADARDALVWLVLDQACLQMRQQALRGR